MKEVAVEVFGKLNIALNVLGKKENLHLIEAPSFHVNVGDFVKVKRAAFSSVEYSVSGISRGGVEKLADLLKADGFGDFEVKVQKNFPIAGGMGGSSADVAAFLAAVALLCDIDDVSLDRYASLCGSDVTFMFRHAAGIIEGTGDEVKKLDPIAMTFVAARMGTGVTSAQCYKKFDLIGESGKVVDVYALLEALKRGDIQAADSLAVNALERSARSLCQGISLSYGEFERINCVPHLTGSGNTVFCFARDFETALKISRDMDRSFSPIALNSVDKPWIYR